MSDIIKFESIDIRRVWKDEQWYFAVVDVIAVLTETSNAGRYWSDMKRRSDGDELYAICVKFSMKNPKNNRTYQTECANREGLFRIIQSVPSSNAEPFKQWLARVGNERVEEIQNPELAVERIRGIYRLKGYDEAWIEKRLQSIGVRNELTDEWDDRGVEQGMEYAILTAEISKGTFNLTPSQHKELKGLKRDSLRDHMTSLELVFVMLGEASTTEITRKDDAQGFDENRTTASKGGQIAGDARRALEAQIGDSVISRRNYLPKDKKQMLLLDDSDIDK